MRHVVALHPSRQIVGDAYEEPLSDSNLGRWRTLALSSPEASSAIASVAVTSSAFIVVHSFQAMMKREKSSRTVDR